MGFYRDDDHIQVTPIRGTRIAYYINRSAELPVEVGPPPPLQPRSALLFCPSPALLVLAREQQKTGGAPSLGHRRFLVERGEPPVRGSWAYRLTGAKARAEVGRARSAAP